MTLIDAARRCYAAGLVALPVCGDGSKRPDVPTWRAFLDRVPTVAERRAFNFAAHVGFGILGGPVSGCIDPWDFDCAATFEAFRAAAEASGLGPVVARIRAGCEGATPRGGRRWLVRYPADLPFHDVTLARRPRRDDEPSAPPAVVLIEITTFAILAPSNGRTHPSGHPYVQLAGGFDSIASYDAAEREGLFELARSFDQMPRRAAAPPRDRTPTSGAARPGDDFNQRMTWPALLEPYGWTHVFDRGDVGYWRRPGKSHGVSATVNHGGADLFYPFTSSTTLDANTSYTRFGVYAALAHRGDFAAAARALARDGYGTPRVAERPRPTTPLAAPAAASWRWLRDVDRDYVRWLWRTRLAYGALTLWIGDGGLGKSRASNDVAARMTRGACWPDGDAAEPGNVVILSAEDSPSFTIRPAIEAAGGDVTRVAVVDAVRDVDGAERTFELSTDLAVLEQVLDATAARLVIIDPLSAYFGTRLDSYRDTDVRSVLAPVVALAERRGLAVLGIMHVGKSTDRQARHRALGSVAFVNAARLVFAIGPDPEDDGRRLLVPVKANLCREAATLAFRLEDADGVARVVWESGPVADVNADTVLNGRAVLDTDERQSADDLLRQLLADETWPLSAAAIATAGRAHGIHVRSLQRAASRIGITIRKSGFRNGWYWFPPEDDTPAPEDDTAAPAHEDDTVVFVKDEVAKTTPPRRRHEDDSVCVVSSSGATKTTPSQVSSSQNPNKTLEDDTPHEDDSTGPSRAREADALPACLAALVEPDASDPIGAHDVEEDGE